MASRRQMLGAAYSTEAGTTGLGTAADGLRRRRSALVWGCLGFVLGTMFWSATGHGPTLSAVMPGLAPDQTGSITTAAPAKPSDRLPAYPSSQAVETGRANCVTLVLDRISQQTREDACPAGAPELRFADSAGRQDRLRPLE